MRLLRLMLILIALFELTGVRVCMANEKTEKQLFCEQQWVEINKTKAGYAEVLDNWLKLKDTCKETGIYEFRLANLYERTGKMDIAQGIVAKALTLNTRYQHVLLLSTVLYDYAEMLTDDVRDLVQYEELLARTQTLADDYPNWAPPYEHLANILLYLGRINKAIDSAHKALELNPSSWSGFRSLVLAYTEKKEYSKARPLITQALELNDSLFSDTEIMYAAAVTYINLKHLETAEQVLLLLSEKNPDVKGDETFQQIVNFLINAKKQNEEKAK